MALDINLGLSAIATGTANSITATYSPAPTLVDKKILFLRSAFANSASVVFNPNGLGSKSVVRGDGSVLIANDIPSADYVMILMYDLANDRWVYLNPFASNEVLTGGTFSNYGFTDTSTIIQALEAIDSAFTALLGNTLISGRLLVGSSSNVATARILSLSATAGSFGLSNTGVLTFPNADASTRGLLTSTDWNTFNNKASKLITANRQTSSYQLVLTDADKIVEMNVGSANNLTVPPNSTVAFSVGTQILLSQYGAGTTTVVAGAGVTIRSADSMLDLRAQYSGATLVKIATDEWYLFGDLA